MGSWRLAPLWRTLIEGKWRPLLRISSGGVNKQGSLLRTCLGSQRSLCAACQNLKVYVEALMGFNQATWFCSLKMTPTVSLEGNDHIPRTPRVRNLCMSSAA